MKKKFFFIFLIIVLFIIYLYISSIDLFPKSLILIEGEKLNVSTLWGINIKEESNTNPNLDSFIKDSTLQTSNSVEEKENTEVGKINFSFNLFNKIPLKEVSVNVLPKMSVVPLGNAIGLKLYTDGVLIVGKTEIEGKKPYGKLDIKEGDRIVSINNEEITSTNDLIESLNDNKGNEINIKYIRDNEELEGEITPVKNQEDEYKLGLWVRDAAAGVGTATFYIPETGMFAALGHGITDADTGNLVTISNGELVTTKIVSIQKGARGKPGEIKGSIEGGTKLGDISKNTKLGVFGKVSNINNMNIPTNEMEIANRTEIKNGKAQIICELESGKKEYYDIEIQKIYLNNNKDNKSMLIKITDKKLLEKTGGIIQGMSGSPIIQDGKFIGAVTHVLVNDPTSGYGVFADMMLKQMMQT